jgi:hypothetical protein
MTSTTGYKIAQDKIPYLRLRISPWVMEAYAVALATFINHRLP